MDLYCQRCGEPWDFDSVYHGDMTTDEKQRFLKGVDCPACKDKEMCTLRLQCKDCEDSLEMSSGCFSCGKDRIKRPFRAEIASVLRMSWEMIRTGSPPKWKMPNGCSAESSGSKHLG